MTPGRSRDFDDRPAGGRPCALRVTTAAAITPSSPSTLGGRREPHSPRCPCRVRAGRSRPSGPQRRRAGLLFVCPVCSGQVDVTADDQGEAQHECSNGCDRTQIGYELFSRQIRSPQATEDHPPQVSSWAPVDLGPVLDGQSLDIAPEMLRRNDGVALLYRGRLHSVNAEPEAGRDGSRSRRTAGQLAAGGRSAASTSRTRPGTSSRALARSARHLIATGSTTCAQRSRSTPTPSRRC